jgi:hypothetical protein
MKCRFAERLKTAARHYPRLKSSPKKDVRKYEKVVEQGAGG